LDETPPESDTSGFFVAMLLRNIFRALSITPILISTHTGAHNAVPTRGRAPTPAELRPIRGFTLLRSCPMLSCRGIALTSSQVGPTS
jgi:hypothetical protein